MTPQTPPTDRPLTAGDVPLLREGDVLRVTNADSFLAQKGFPNGSSVRFRSAAEEFIDIADLPYSQGSGFYRFTFVSRPATSEASEVAFSVDDLAQEIRRVDGNHSLGAGALAEALMPFLTAQQEPV